MLGYHYQVSFIITVRVSVFIIIEAFEGHIVCQIAKTVNLLGLCSTWALPSYPLKGHSGAD